MQNKVETGMAAQQEAEAFLSGKGYLILERNFRAKQGEIDLIVRDGDYIVFTEVKYRSGLRYGYPREAVNYRKQQHIRRTALYYITRFNLTGQDFRFDVVELLRDDDGLHITHLENAF